MEGKLFEQPQEETTKNSQETHSVLQRIEQLLSDRPPQLREEVAQLFEKRFGNLKIYNFADFERDMVIYCVGILRELDALGEEELQHTALIFPGRSGLGVEPVVEAAIRQRYASRPTSVRFPAESTLFHYEEEEKKDAVMDVRDPHTGERRWNVPVPFAQEGLMESWDRSEVATPELDLLMKNIQRAYILDPHTAGGRTYRLCSYYLSSYPLNDVAGIELRGREGDLEVGKPVVYRDEDGLKWIRIQNTTSKDNVDIPLKDLFYKYAGLEKVPVTEVPDKQIANPQEAGLTEYAALLQREFSYPASVQPEEYEDLRQRTADQWEEYGKQQALQSSPEKWKKEGYPLPSPTTFVPESTTSPEVRELLRAYLQELGRVADEAAGVIEQKD